MSSVSVIGSGFSGLSAAACLAKDGNDVAVFEKNSTPGGRARKFEEQGFVFDMGPSWYWMPEVFENFFNRFGKNSSEYYELIRLDPSYRIFFSKEDVMDVPSGLKGLHDLFEKRESGSGVRLTSFLEEGKFKYQVGINKLVHKPGLSITELFDAQLFKGIFKLDVFQSLSTHVRKNFKDPGLIQLLEFPVLFLGAMPSKTPALYSLMNYADMALGTWYPKGGMYKIIEGMFEVAKDQGVKFHFNSEVKGFELDHDSITSIIINGVNKPSDYVVASADYHHVEQQLLPRKFRNYSEEYWNQRVMAPSSLIFYVGINKRVKNLLHHNLFFDQDFGLHAREIYEHPDWPTNPLFYISCPSKSDPSVAPEGCENLFLLMPVAPGLNDEDEIREKYFNLMIDRLEYLTGEPIRKSIIYKRSYAHRDFIDDYHAFKGNAYGLANTLSQTANLKPSIVNKKVKNLFYTGQLTVPGPGVPPSIISGQVVAQELNRQRMKKELIGKF
ncbi:MAG: phytoene desaturase [Cyclobacteriaceae bacterium]|nr:phytoene desaturase [Cyclobacteriaceae bacterium]